MAKKKPICLECGRTVAKVNEDDWCAECEEMWSKHDLKVSPHKCPECIRRTKELAAERAVMLTNAGGVKGEGETETPSFSDILHGRAE